MTATRHVNIVVVGDPGVGKTSLILAAATEAFPDNPVPTLPPTALPAELTPDGPLPPPCTPLLSTISQRARPPLSCTHLLAHCPLFNQPAARLNPTRLLTGVPSLVVDTSSRPEDRPALEIQCLKVRAAWLPDSLP